MYGSGSQAIIEGNQWTNSRRSRGRNPEGKLHGALALGLTFSYLIQSKPTVGGPHPAQELTIKNMPP